MTHLKTLGFLILCLALGVGIGKVCLMWRGPASKGFENSEGPTLITGVGDAPAQRGFAVRADRLPTAASLKEFDGLYATTIGIPCDLVLTQNTASQQALRDAVKLAHARHFTVVLLPDSLATGGGSDRAPFSMGLLTAASLAQNAGVDYFCISALSRAPDMDYWRSAISDVRGIYKGKIILAAYPGVIYKIDCWNLVDVIGVIGPLPLPRRLPDAPEDVTVHDMRVAWDCSLTALESLAKANDKTLALLNMNIPAEVSARLPDPNAPNVTPPKNPALQQLLYESLLLETKGRSEMTEMLLFDWGDERDAPSYSTPGKLPPVQAKMRDAWDPKKPRVVETMPEEIPAANPGDGGDIGATGAGN